MRSGSFKRRNVAFFFVNVIKECVIFAFLRKVKVLDFDYRVYAIWAGTIKGEWEI